MRRLRRLVILLVTLLVLAGVAYALFATVLRLPGGPLDNGELRSTGQTGMSVGDSVSFVAPVLRNDSGRTVTIEKLEPIDVPRGVRVRGVRLVTRLPEGGESSVRGWPPDRIGGLQVRRSEDAELEGGETARAVVGLRLTRPGTRVVRGLRVEYRDRGLRRVAELDHEYTLTTGG